MKVCTKCNSPRTLEQFTKNSKYKDGYHSWCKPCVNEYSRNHYNSKYKEKLTTANACISCGKNIRKKSKRCITCSNIFRRDPASRHLDNGYAYVSGHPDNPNAKKNGSIAEHILVMQQILGRPLLKGENVHHKNGVRDDNRPENLEIWSSRQPAGQRVEDKVDFAIEILNLYAPHLLKNAE